MNVTKEEYKIFKKALKEKRDRALFAKCDNVKWLYDNVPSLRKRIEREG